MRRGASSSPNVFEPRIRTFAPVVASGAGLLAGQPAASKASKNRLTLRKKVPPVPTSLREKSFVFMLVSFVGCEFARAIFDFLNVLVQAKIPKVATGNQLDAGKANSARRNA